MISLVAMPGRMSKSPSAFAGFSFFVKLFGYFQGIRIKFSDRVQCVVDFQNSSNVGLDNVSRSTEYSNLIHHTLTRSTLENSPLSRPFVSRSAVASSNEGSL